MNLIAEQRDLLFVLYEMLGIENLFDTEKFQEHSRDIYDMTLDLVAKLGNEEILPTLSKGDKESAHFNNGEVTIPQCYKDLHGILRESGLYTMHLSEENGGQGFPTVLDAATLSLIHISEPTRPY